MENKRKRASYEKIGNLCSKEVSFLESLIDGSFQRKRDFTSVTSSYANSPKANNDLEVLEVTDSTDSTSIDVSDILVHDNGSGALKMEKATFKQIEKSSKKKDPLTVSEISENDGTEFRNSNKKNQKDASKGLFKKQTTTRMAPKTPSQTAKNAWICCFCAANFQSYQEAHSHEQECIHSVGEDALQNILYYHKNISFGKKDANDENAEKVAEPDSTSLRQPRLSLNVTLSDDTLRQALQSISQNILTVNEQDAERELALMTRDKLYYDHMNKKRSEQVECKNSSGKEVEDDDDNTANILTKVKKKFSDAYALIKEEEAKIRNSGGLNANLDENSGEKVDIVHDYNTIYINVSVKNSIKVVKHEMDRIAKLMWAEYGTTNDNQFSKVRAGVQLQIVRLISLALATDFTPKTIASQLASDLRRLMKPQLKERGIDIDVEIEYHQGAFFIVAVNIKSIDWLNFMRYTHFQAIANNLKRRQTQQQRADDGMASSNKSIRSSFKVPSMYKKKVFVSFPSVFEVIAFVLYYLYYFPWFLSLPICWVSYYPFGKELTHEFIIHSVTDDILQYIEQKGMEMVCAIKSSKHQAPFMLEVLRELRTAELNLKRKQKQHDKGDESAIEIIGPLLGKAIKSDKNPLDISSLAIPESLEMDGLDITLPVGFRRLRWAMLNDESKFIHGLRTGANTKNIEIGKWSSHSEHIGLPDLPEGVNEEEFIGATRESSYLLPKNAFVKENTAYETATITEYNELLFVIKVCAKTPEVPFGNTFESYTQFVIINLGKENVRVIFSMEAVFPNGAPMVARQIKSGLRTGATEYATLFSEYVFAYANVYP